MLLARALQDSHTVILQELLPFSCALYCSSSWKTQLCFYELFHVLISLVLMCLLLGLDLVCCLNLGCRELKGVFLKTISFYRFLIIWDALHTCATVTVSKFHISYKC